MSRKKLTIYDLLISCPGDVQAGVDSIKNAVDSFNRSLGSSNGIHVQIKYWGTDVYPASGDSPQNIINKQIVESADMVVAIFGNRFGTATDNYGSGTEEEIKKMMDADKQVFLYFLNQKINPHEFDTKQFDQIQELKENYRGLYHTVDSFDKLEKDFQNHLSLYFLENISNTSTQNSKKRKPKLEILQDTSEFRIDEYFENILNEIHKKIDTKIYLIDSIVLSKTTKENDNKSYSIKAQLPAESIKSQLPKDFHYKSFFQPEEVSINQTVADTIKEYFEIGSIELSSNFFDLGNLTKTKDLASISLTGNNNAITLRGTDDEKNKFRKINDLYHLINEYFDFKKYFNQLKEIKLLNLYIHNSGTTIDEDIDIEVIVNKKDLFKFKNIPIPGRNIIKEINESEFLEKIFVASENEKIKSYPDYPRANGIPYNPRLIYPGLGPMRDFEAEYEDEKEVYIEELKRIFCYTNFFPDDTSALLTFNLNYLKHHSSIYFPSYIPLAGSISSIDYTITSKHSPDYIEEKLKISIL